MKGSPETHMENVGAEETSFDYTQNGEKAQELPAPTRTMKTVVLSEGYEALIVFGHLDPGMI